MRPLLFHPSGGALRAWLHGEADDVKLDAHVAVCQSCAAALERLAEEDAAHDTDDLAGALALALAPPDDLPTRLEEKVTKRLDSRVMFGVLSDLFAAGIETSRMLILEEPVEPEE
ncbi:MAG: hypothetical protein OEW83_04920 [Acidimicrobiia bacterium]|nr:hypothetical protein [Acidimicrobiia bacterium]